LLTETKIDRFFYLIYVFAKMCHPYSYDALLDFPLRRRTVVIDVGKKKNGDICKTNETLNGIR